MLNPSTFILSFSLHYIYVYFFELSRPDRMSFCHFDSKQRPNSSLRKGISKRETIVIGYDDHSSYEEYAS